MSDSASRSAHRNRYRRDVLVALASTIPLCKVPCNTLLATGRPIARCKWCDFFVQRVQRTSGEVRDAAERHAETECTCGACWLCRCAAAGVAPVRARHELSKLLLVCPPVGWQLGLEQLVTRARCPWCGHKVQNIAVTTNDDGQPTVTWACLDGCNP